MVVAAHEEADRIEATVRALRGAFPGAAIWVGDDASRDGTAERRVGRGSSRLGSHPRPYSRRRRLLSSPMPNIEAHITGNIWKIEVAVGDTISEGDTVVILESMKMEIPVESEDDGTVKEIRCEEGQAVSEGDVLIVLE